MGALAAILLSELGHSDNNSEKDIAHFWVTKVHAGHRTGLSLESPLLVSLPTD